MESVFPQYGSVISSSNSNFTFDASTGNQLGVALVRYVPVNTAGERGNITYVHILVIPEPEPCVQDTCNLIPNGGFESTIVNCGGGSGITQPNLNCWVPLSSSPDLYARNCSNTSYDIPLWYYVNPPIDTWNNGANGNDHVLGLLNVSQNQGGEAIQVPLSTGLINGAEYTLRFKATIPNENNPWYPAPVNLTIGVSQEMIYSASSNLNPTPDIMPLTPNHYISQSGQWQSIDTSFIYNGPSSWSNLIIGLDDNQQTGSATQRYVYLDDIELIPTADLTTISLPTTICINQSFDLEQYVSITGGTFSGAGVTNNTFDASLAGIGVHQISYAYTMGNGCADTTETTIEVVNGIIDIQVIATTDVICLGETTVLTSSGADTYSWSPSTYLDQDTGSVVISTPINSITYTVTGIDTLGCIDSDSITIVVHDLDPICCADPDILIPDGATSSSIGPIPNGSFVHVEGLFTVNSNFNLVNVEMRMAPNAKIDILSGNTLDLHNCKLFACFEMWDGIYTNPGASIIAVKSRFEDALNAIHSLGGGHYELYNCVFNKNNIGLRVDSFNVPHTGIIEGSIFECTSNNSINSLSTLIEPMAGEKSHFGVYCINNSDITFGVIDNTQNTFDDIEVGIFTRGTHAKIYRNKFINIHQPLTYIGKDVPSIGWPVWGQDSYLLIGDDDGQSHENNFEDCTHGIFLDGKCAFEIRKNTFDNITSPNFLSQYSKAIFVRNSTPLTNPSYGIIADNEFDEFEAGIFCFKNDMDSLDIFRNKFSNFNNEIGTAVYILQNAEFPTTINSNLINPLMNQKGRYAIRVQSAVETSSQMTIERNTIKNVRHGIWTTNYKNLEIKNQHEDYNSIGNTDAGIYYYTNNLNDNFSVGIKSENCPYATIEFNQIEKSMPQPTAAMNDYLFGISVESNGMESVIKENIMTRLGKGLYFYGQPNFPLHVSCNGMYVNRTGLTFDNTYIGDQGQPNPNGIAQDNQWSLPSTSPWLGIDKDGGLLSTFYIRSNSLPFKVPDLQMDPTGAAVQSVLVLNTPYECSFGCVNPPCLLPNIEHAVKKTAPFDQLPPLEKKLVDIELFKVLRDNPSYLTMGLSSDTTFQQFVDSVENTNTGNIYRYVEKIKLGDTLGAKDEVDFMYPNFIAETNHKIVREIYWRTWLKNIEAFTPEDSAALYQVAIQKPHEGGSAVYDARVMLKLDINDLTDASTKSAIPTSFNDESIVKLNVYPNPANTYIEYALNGTNSEVHEAIILDMSGREIDVNSMDSNKLKFGNLANGMYTLRVILENGEQHSATFVVN